GVFNGTIAAGAPVSGRYIYYGDQFGEGPSGPYEWTYPRDGALELHLGSLSVTNFASFDIYGNLVFIVRNDDPVKGDGLSASEIMVYPTAFKPLPGAPNLQAVGAFSLDDSTGTALNSTDLLDFPLTAAGFAAFGTREGRLVVRTTTNFVDYVEL